MKKIPRIYRILLLMLALSAVTMSLAFVTIGKYSTNNGARDSARVAAFGVRIKATDTSSFQTQYYTNGHTITVKSYNGDKVVAPGTSDESGISFSVTGTPNVATELVFDIRALKDVFLKTELDGEEYIYRPIQFVFTCGGEVLAKGTIGTVAEILERTVISFEPGEKLDREISLSWEWAYVSDESIDAFDTALGDMAAELVPENMKDGEDYCLDIEYEISITVNQVD